MKNPSFYERSKHFHFVREVINSGSIRVEKASSEDNPTDVMTNILPVARFQHCLRLASVFSGPVYD